MVSLITTRPRLVCLCVAGRVEGGGNQYQTEREHSAGNQHGERETFPEESNTGVESLVSVVG